MFFLQQTYSKTATVLCDVVALVLPKKKKISLWHGRGAWMKKITSVSYNTLKLDELKYNAIASLF